MSRMSSTTSSQADNSSAIEAGDCFRFREKPERHLWIVVSDPNLDSDRVLIVNVTSYRPDVPSCDPACLLECGDHAFIEHTSYINYYDSRVYTAAHLISLLARDKIELHDRLDASVLKRVRDGASLSRRIPFENLMVLIDQEF